MDNVSPRRTGGGGGGTSGSGAAGGAASATPRSMVVHGGAPASHGYATASPSLSGGLRSPAQHSTPLGSHSHHLDLAETASVRRRITEDQLKREVSTLKARNRELIMQTEAQAALCDELTAKYQRAEDRVNEHLMDNTAKILEGKVNALNAVVSEKSLELAALRAQGHERDETAARERAEAADTRAQRDGLERELGVRTKEADRARVELAAASARVAELEGQVERGAERHQDSATACAAQVTAAQRAISALEEESARASQEAAALRAQAATLREAEAAQKAAFAGAAAEAARLRAEGAVLKAGEAELGREKDRVVARASELEALLEAQRAEAERERRLREQAELDGCAERARRTELEAQVRGKDAVEQKGSHLEKKLEVLQQCLVRGEQQLEEEVNRHKATKRRADDLESRGLSVATMKNQVIEAESLAQHHQDTANMLQQQLQSMEERIAAQEAAVNASAEQVSATNGELRQAQVCRPFSLSTSCVSCVSAAATRTNNNRWPNRPWRRSWRRSASSPAVCTRWRGRSRASRR